MGSPGLDHLCGVSRVDPAIAAVANAIDPGPVKLSVPAWRGALYEELHARPFPVLETPLRVSHIAALPDEGAVAGERELAHLRALCEQFGQSPPAAGESCFYRDFGAFELRWERHTEFCTWTVLCKGSVPQPMQQTPLCALSAGWLGALPGRIVAALHLAVEWQPDPVPTRDELRRHFDGHRMIGSRVLGGRAEVWTAFRLHQDGFGRFLVFHQDLNPCETGRLVQQLLELETYRLMALITLPLARECQDELSAMDRELATVVTAMSGAGERDRSARSAESKPGAAEVTQASSSSAAGDRALLDRLCDYAARLERLRARVSYRLAATRAYYALVSKRIEQLDIDEIRGLQTLAYFLDRRLTPAVRTCEAFATRLDDLSQRIDRAAELLRTRVDLCIEEQNQSLLASMNRRSRMQLRLQQAVEGLSVAAISYYVVQLVHALAAGLAHVVPAVDPERVTAVSVPVVLAGTLMLVMRLRRGVAGHDE